MKGEMAGAPSAALTQKQATTLRLAYCHLTSKEIARLRGVTRFAIDAQIERAMQQLGVATRIDAARWAMQHIPGPYERIIYELQPLAAAPVTPSITNPPNERWDTGGDGLAEAVALYEPPTRFPSDVRHWRWGNPDDLKPMARIWMIPLLAFGTLAIVFTLLAMGQAASQWVDRNLPAYRQSGN